MLILLQKPGKPVGPLTSVRPIVLLSALRKDVLRQTSCLATDGYVPQCRRVTIEFLCRRAFDTIRRDKLLEVLQSFLDEPELRMIRFLLAATSLEPRLSTGDCHAFASTVGTPQGDSLSPVSTWKQPPATFVHAFHLDPQPMPGYRWMWSTPMTLISSVIPCINEIERIAPACLAEWSLPINAANTERTSVSRQVDRAHAN